MKKIFLASVTVSVFVAANSLQFKDMNAGITPLTRQMPQNSGALLSYYDAIKDAKNCVVNISTQKVSKQNVVQNPFANDPFFRQFFGDLSKNMVPKERVERSLGSGVIVSEDGYIVTNNHVVANADKILINLPGERKEYEAKLVGADARSDLAVIKIEAKGLKAIYFADSSLIKEGDVVFAIGNPFGVGESISHGIVSALNKAGLGVNEYENFIQTDAPINPGNSGGALIDSRGALVGINTMIISSGGGNNGIGFAIPSAMVKRVVGALVQKGKVERGFMGVSIDSLSKKMQEYYKRDKGAIIVDVGVSSPAEKGGLRRGDLVILFNGKEVENGIDFRNKIGELNPSDKVNLVVMRDGKLIKLSITLGLSNEVKKQVSSTTSTNEFGIKVESMSAELRNTYRVSNDASGVLITKIDENSSMSSSGLNVGDVVFQIENKIISTPDEFYDELRKSKELKRFYVKRQNRTFMIVSQ
jgi:serine protease Do